MSILDNHTGEFAALLTAFFWTITALSFESASHRIGSVAVNILRLIIGFASTIMALVPVFIILPAVILYKQKVTFTELLGAVVSVGGVALFFL
jgi:drug/metabolite transporter (DMT)-like permease